MKHMRVMVATLVAAIGASVWADQAATVAATNAPVEAKALVPQTTCPLMKGRAVDRKLFVDYEGKRFYVCCRICLKAAQRNPAKYVKELEAAGIALEKTPVAAGKQP
jgi:hypothetical protein